MLWFFFYIPPPFKDKHNLLNFAILFLLHRNIASQTVARLKDVARRISSCLDFEQHSRERSASLDLLLRFQRLLISKLYPGDSVGQTSEISSKLLKVLKCLVLFWLFYLGFLTYLRICSSYTIRCTNFGGLYFASTFFFGQIFLF